MNAFHLFFVKSIQLGHPFGAFEFRCHFEAKDNPTDAAHSFVTNTVEEEPRNLCFRRSQGRSVKIPICSLQNIDNAFVDHLLNDAEAVEIIRIIVVLNMNHHDVLTLEFFHIAWEHVICANGFDFLLLGTSAPRCKLDVFARDPFNKQ